LRRSEQGTATEFTVMKTHARTIAIWIFGLAASGIFGAIIGENLSAQAIGNHAIEGGYGGMFAFACARLWLKDPANGSDQYRA
jgi:hypothetical protein